MDAERHERPDARGLEPLGLHGDELVPVPPQLGAAASARVAGAGHRRGETEEGERGQVGVAHPLGVKVEIDEALGLRHARTLADGGGSAAAICARYGTLLARLMDSRAAGGLSDEEAPSSDSNCDGYAARPRGETGCLP